MKHYGWVAGGGILAVLVGIAELSAQLHGPDWAVGLAAACITLVGIGAMFLIAKWADEHMKADREKQLREHRERTRE